MCFTHATCLPIYSCVVCKCGKGTFASFLQVINVHCKQTCSQDWSPWSPTGCRLPNSKKPLFPINVCYSFTNLLSMQIYYLQHHGLLPSVLNICEVLGRLPFGSPNITHLTVSFCCGKYTTESGFNGSRIQFLLLINGAPWRERYQRAAKPSLNQTKAAVHLYTLYTIDGPDI